MFCFYFTAQYLYSVVDNHSMLQNTIIKIKKIKRFIVKNDVFLGI